MAVSATPELFRVRASVLLVDSRLSLTPKVDVTRLAGDVGGLL